MEDQEYLYFKNAQEWRNWLHENHHCSKGVHLLFYKVSSTSESMRWEEAVQVALCYGWIDSTVRKIDDDSRKQFYSPRKNKSIWSKVNKNHIEKLIAANLMHESGLAKIEIAKQNGSWNSLDSVDNMIIPEDLQVAFNSNSIAFENYQKFSPSYRKGYLYWLSQAKREETRNNRIAEIISLSEQNKKARV